MSTPTADDLIIGTNSFVDADYADAYFNTHPAGDYWQAQGEADHVRGLINAVRGIENLWPNGWLGVQTTPSQALSWPRRGVINRRASSGYLQFGTGAYVCYGETEYPTLLKDAQCEEALALLIQRDDPAYAKRLSLQYQGVSKASVGGGISEEYGQDNQKHAAIQLFGGCILSQDAWRMLSELRQHRPGEGFMAYRYQGEGGEVITVNRNFVRL